MEDFIMEFLSKNPVNNYLALAITGSYAINEQKKLSDIDLLFITSEPREGMIKIYNGHYFSISFKTPEMLLSYKKNVNELMYAVETFKRMKILYDPEHLLSKLKEDMEAFQWTSVLKEHSKHKAKEELIGFLEEVQKSVEGLKSNHVGKMLNGIYGLTYGMFYVIRLRDQICTGSDNEFYDAVVNQLEDKDPIRELAPIAFGLTQSTLHDRIDAGLEIFIHVSNSLMDFYAHEEKDYMMKLVQEVIVVI
ncbi:MAG: nucleotidyltransferase domain-containing protein [Clostridia bacterium]|nr:nucleotidyltransferase domain-containing protein [Clostridia bacterium]